MNFLDNGAVLPSGLLGFDSEAGMRGFNKTYKNHALRMGVVVASYPASDPNNHSKLCNEYDVLVFEQQEDEGTTIIRYKNCLSAEGMGSLADFFEKSLRVQKRKPANGTIDTKDQNGAVVLILCLDGVSEKGIVLGALTHPDRKTTITSDAPHLEGEYNGIHVVVNEDGSTTFTFKGATDNDGKIIDSSQGPTEIRIEKNGSYQVMHKTITQRFDKSGDASLTTDGDISNTTKKNFNVTATTNIALTSTGDTNMTANNWVAKASGSATLSMNALSITAQGNADIQAQQFTVEAQAMANIKAPQITLDGLVSLGGAGGQPVLILSTQFLGVGNLGLPVISTAIAGFATKVLAT